MSSNKNQNRDDLISNKVKHGYSRNALRVIRTTFKNFEKENQNLKTFISEIQKYDQEVSILLCYLEGPENLTTTKMINFLNEIGLSPNPQVRDVETLVEFIKKKASNNFSSKINKNKKRNFHSFLDGLEKESKKCKRITSSVEKNWFSNKEDFLLKAQASTWPIDLQSFVRTNLSLNHLNQLEIKFGKGNLTRRLDKTLQWCYSKREKYEVFKGDTEDDIFSFIQDLSGNFIFFIPIFFLDSITMNDEKGIFSCPKCCINGMTKTDFFDHLYCAKSRKCIFHLGMGNMIKDLFHYTEESFDMEKKISKSYLKDRALLENEEKKRNVLSNTTSVLQRKEEYRVDIVKPASQQSAKPTSTKNSWKMSTQVPSHNKSNQLSDVWGQKQPHSQSKGWESTSKGQSKGWESTSKGLSGGWDLGLDKQPNKTNVFSSSKKEPFSRFVPSPPSFVHTEASSNRNKCNINVPPAIRQDFKRSMEMIEKNNQIQNTVIVKVYPVSQDTDEITKNLKNLFLYEYIGEDILRHLVHQSQRYWFVNFDEILKARHAAKNWILSCDYYTMMERNDAILYFMTVLDNAWFFDYDIKMNIRLQLQSPGMQNRFPKNYIYCPFCIEVSRYHDKDKKLKNSITISDLNTRSKIAMVEKRYGCNGCIRDELVRKLSRNRHNASLRGKEGFWKCAHYTSKEFMEHICKDVHPLMAGATLTYFKSMFDKNYMFDFCVSEQEVKMTPIMKKVHVTNKKTKSYNIPSTISIISKPKASIPLKISNSKEGSKQISGKRSSNSKLFTTKASPTVNDNPIPLKKLSNKLDTNHDAITKKKSSSQNESKTQVEKSSKGERKKKATAAAILKVVEKVMETKNIPNELMRMTMQYAKMDRFEEKKNRSIDDWTDVLSKENFHKLLELLDDDKESIAEYSKMYEDNAKNLQFEKAHTKAITYIEEYYKDEIIKAHEYVDESFGEDGSRDDKSNCTMSEEEENEFGENLSSKVFEKAKETKYFMEKCKEIISDFNAIINFNEWFDYGYQRYEYERTNKIRKSMKNYRFPCPCHKAIVPPGFQLESGVCDKTYFSTLQGLIDHLREYKCMVHQAISVYVSELFKTTLKEERWYKDLVGIFLFDKKLMCYKNVEIFSLLRYVFFFSYRVIKIYKFKLKVSNYLLFLYYIVFIV